MLADVFDTFLLDLDGTLYVGDQALPHAPGAVARLREAGKRLRFMTNDPRPSRDQAAAHLRSLGFEVRPEEVVTVGWATARFLARQGHDTAYVVGTDALKGAISEAGVRVAKGRGVDVVVVGADETTGYEGIKQAALGIQQGAAFVATNLDGSFPMPEGRWPGTGAIVEAVRATTGESPTVVGKPEPSLFELALEDRRSWGRVAVVGDNPGTDILGAHRAGLAGILVASDPAAVGPLRGPRSPDAVVDSLAGLFDDAIELSTREQPTFPWPDRLAPGVGMVVLDDEERVLLHRRRVEDAWAPPSGHVELGETVEQAALRELSEETGLDVELEALVGVVSDPAYQVIDLGSGNRTQFVTTLFRARVNDGSLEGSDEGLAWGWFDPGDLPTPLTDYTQPWLRRALA